MRQRLPVIGLSLGLTLMIGCGTTQDTPPVSLDIHQQWQLQPGDRLADHAIIGGLGDISIDLAGKSLQTPLAGRLQPLEAASDCALFLSPEIPAYGVRLCGLKRMHWGDRQPGDPLGQGHWVSLALLRKQAEGNWVMVEPSTEILVKFLNSKSSSEEDVGSKSINPATASTQ